MATRVPGSMRTRQTIGDLIEGRLSSRNARSALVQAAARAIIEEALETKQTDALGGEYFRAVRRPARATATVRGPGG